MHFQYPAFVLSLQLLVLLYYLCVDHSVLLLYVLPLLASFSICDFLVSCTGLFFSAWRSSFSICCNMGLVVVNFLNFRLSIKLLISLLNLN